MTTTQLKEHIKSKGGSFSTRDTKVDLMIIARNLGETDIQEWEVSGFAVMAISKLKKYIKKRGGGYTSKDKKDHLVKIAYALKTNPPKKMEEYFEVVAGDGEENGSSTQSSSEETESSSEESASSGDEDSESLSEDESYDEESESESSSDGSSGSSEEESSSGDESSGSSGEDSTSEEDSEEDNSMSTEDDSYSDSVLSEEEEESIKRKYKYTYSISRHGELYTTIAGDSRIFRDVMSFYDRDITEKDKARILRAYNEGKLVCFSRDYVEEHLLNRDENLPPIKYENLMGSLIFYEGLTKISAGHFHVNLGS